MGHWRETSKQMGANTQSQALRGVWGWFQELQGRLRMTFLAWVKTVSSLKTGQAEVVRSAGQSTRSRT